MRTVTAEIAAQLGNASWIRRMFEAGVEMKRRLGAERVFDFSLGNPDVPGPPELRTVLGEIAARAAEPLAFGYPPNAGLPGLRAALARKLAAEQDVPSLEAGHVLVSCGAAGALNSFFRAVLAPGDEVVCPAPFFVEYGFYCGHYGGVLKPVPSRPPAFDLDLPALLAAIGPRTRAVLLNSPNNPAGCIYPAEALDTLAARIDELNRRRKRPLFLLADEPYRFLAYDGAAVPPVLPRTRFAVVVGSFSKSLALAGERIGYLAVNPRMPQAGLLMDALAMTTRTLGFVNAPVIGQLLAERVLDLGVDLGIYARRRALMAEVLRGAGISFAMPRGAFYFFPAAPGGDDLAFVQRLLEERILATPGTGFGFPGHFRLSFSVDDAVIEGAAEGFRRAVAAAGEEK